MQNEARSVRILCEQAAYFDIPVNSVAIWGRNREF